jgi:hypothetical protein
MFKAGDFVLHSRQGPGRIVEVLPDHIVVRPRSGNLYKVNLGIAEQELMPAPSDGFIALLAQHDYSADRLLQQIPEIVERITGGILPGNLPHSAEALVCGHPPTLATDRLVSVRRLLVSRPVGSSLGTQLGRQRE